MPIYEYRCPNGHVFELFQRMDDPPPEACPTCEAKPLERVLYPVAVHFKGSGFYSTDYGRSRKTSKDTDGGDSKGGDSTGGDSKSGDSKAPDSKSDTKKAESSKSSD